MTTSLGDRASPPGDTAAVDRAMVVLHALERAGDGARLSDLARDTGLAHDPRDDDVRRQAWAVSLGERVAELAAVAAPVFGVDPAGRRPAVLVGALSIWGLRTRFDGAELVRRRDLVVSRAAALSGTLGAPTRPEDPT